MKITLRLFLVILMFGTFGVYLHAQDSKNDPEKKKKAFTISFEQDDERANTEEVHVYIRAINSAIRSFTVFTHEPQTITSLPLPESGLVSIKIKAGKTGPTQFFVAALDASQSVVEQRAFATGRSEKTPQSLTVQAPTELIEVRNADKDWADRISKSKSERKLLHVKAAQSQVIDSNYALELRPRFFKQHFDAKKITVRHFHGTSQRKPDITVDMVWDKEDPTRPANIISVPISLEPGRNQFEITISGTKGSTAVIDDTELVTYAEVDCTATCRSMGRRINTRAIVGFEQIGASSSASASRPFLNLFVNIPIGYEHGKFGPRSSVWTDLRLTSSAAARFVDLTKITGAFGPVTSPLASNEVVQTFRINTGVEVRISKYQSHAPFVFPGRASLSFIAGGGISAPLQFQKENNSIIFKIPTVGGDADTNPSPEFREFYRGLQTALKDQVVLRELNDADRHIVFQEPERVRFYKRAFAGLRAKIDFWENDDRRMDMSPAMFDVTLGFDEAIYDGYKPRVLSFEGFMPFPIDSKNVIYLYGGGSLALTRRGEAPVTPVYMDFGSQSDLVPGSTITVPGVRNSFLRSSRDTYFFGIGFDFLKLFSSDPKP